MDVDYGDKLPAEIWVKIFDLLPQHDLRALSAVCTRFYSILNNASWWTKDPACGRRMWKSGLRLLRTVPRFSLMPIDLSYSNMDGECWEKLLWDIMFSTDVMELDISFPSSLNYLPVELFVSAVCQVRKVNLSGFNHDIHMPRDLFLAFFARQSGMDKHGKCGVFALTEELILRKCDLRSVPVAMFQAVFLCERIKSIDITEATLTSTQLLWLGGNRKDAMTAAEVDRLPRITYSIDGQNMKEGMTYPSMLIIREIIDGLFERLVSLDLSLPDFRGISFTKWANAFQKMNKLESLSLGGSNLKMHAMPTDLLAETFAKLKKLCLENLLLCRKQWNMVLERIAERGVLKEISLSKMSLDNVPAEVIVKCFLQMRLISLSQMKLSRESWQGLFLKVFPVSEVLDSLSIKNINLSSIFHINIAARGLPKVRYLDLSRTTLLDEYWEPLLVDVVFLNASDFRYLNLSGVDLREVCIDAFAFAMASVRKVKLAGAKVTLEQLSYMFYTIVDWSITKIDELDLSRVQLSQVDSVLLARALTKIRRVDITKSSLTNEQLKYILYQTAAFNRLEHLTIGSLFGMKRNVINDLKKVMFVKHN